ncbi:eukaryotic translation initiation factor 3 subunit G-like [Dysidea avara]|uniref:eukaryotic translation initiation factor 3 subunit G-like n=1 Tax=Dysidea avara TaxID=196820 RepID=UPI0033262691
MSLEDDFTRPGNNEGSSWAALMEEEESSKITPDNLPKPSETIDGNTKTVIEFSVNDTGKVVKTTRIYRIERRRVSKGILKRKMWKRFGDAENDKGSGPDPATTQVADEVFLTLTTSKENLDQSETEMLKKALGPKMVSCRICKGDHWTTKCPFKDTMKMDDPDDSKGNMAPGDNKPELGGPPTTKYIPPSLRGEGASRQGESMNRGGRDDTATVRVTNLSEETKEQDLRDLFGHFGPIHRVYLAKDKTMQRSKGFAFINYYKRTDAQMAIQELDGHGYDHLILKVEWAKPSGRD